jgi:integrase
MSLDSFERHVQPHLRLVRRGKLRLVPITELVFGTSSRLPFQPTNLRRRALTAWKRAGVREIGLHEARHTFASMIAAGVNAKTLSTYMGHAKRLHHLRPLRPPHAGQRVRG